MSPPNVINLRYLRCSVGKREARRLERLVLRENPRKPEIHEFHGSIIRSVHEQDIFRLQVAVNYTPGKDWVIIGCFRSSIAFEQTIYCGTSTKASIINFDEGTNNGPSTAGMNQCGL